VFGYSTPRQRDIFYHRNAFIDKRSRQTARAEYHLDARGGCFAVLSELGIGTVQRLNLDLILANISLELLALTSELGLILGLDLGDRSLQLLDSSLTALPVKNK